MLYTVYMRTYFNIFLFTGLIHVPVYLLFYRRMSSSKGQPKKPYVDPIRAGGGKPYVDPLKREYVDPLKIQTNSFEFSQKKVEYKPYTSFHVFEPSNIDPLTGRPYKSNRKKKEEVLEPTETKVGIIDSRTHARTHAHTHMHDRSHARLHTQ